MTVATLAAPRVDRLHLTRLIVGYAAVLGTLPYLSLKLAWLSGGTIGIADPSLAGDASMAVLNTVTIAMDLVGVAIALAFTHGWGQRLPAWLVLGPMWVGTGLLAPIAVTMPVVGIGSLFASDTAAATGGFLEPWVQPLVYTGFAWQGVTLILAFVLYARVRWAVVFTARTGDVPRGATHPVQVVLAGGAAVLALAVAALHLAHAAGSTLGLSAAAAEAFEPSSYLVEGIHGVLALLAGAGIVLLVHRAGRRLPFWLPTSLTWAGAGAMFAWGMWGVVNALGSTFLTRGAEAMPLVRLHDLAKVLAGLVIGLTGLLLLAEQRAVSYGTSTAGRRARPPA
jgi:hypothetical protein